MSRSNISEHNKASGDELHAKDLVLLQEYSRCRELKCHNLQFAFADVASCKNISKQDIEVNTVDT